MRLEALVGVEAGAGERDQRRQMRQDAGHERATQVGQQPLPGIGVMQQVARAVGRPQAEVDVRARADPVSERLGRERGDEPVLRLRDATNGVPEPELLVRGPKRVPIADRDLLLAGAVLVDGLLHLDALGQERVDDVRHHVRGAVHPGRRVAGPVRPGRHLAVVRSSSR